MSQNRYGLDIGTGNFKICLRDKILNEKNIIAISGGETVAFGDEAYDMYEKAPESIDISFPVKNGVIADIKNMQILLQKFYGKINSGKKPLGVNDFYIAVPTDVTDVEKRAFYELVVRSKIKIRNILAVDKAVADAVGAGVDVIRSKGVMMVNIGAQTCDISVLSLGGIVTGKTLETGGCKLDEDIIHAVRREYNLAIGSKTAERLKIELANALPSSEEKTYPGFGRNILSGLPVSCVISESVISSAIQPVLHFIMEEVKSVLERTSPELAVDIIKNGIFLTGGTSNIRNLKELFKKETNISVNTVSNPQESIIRGLHGIISVPELNSLAYVPEDRLFE